MRDARRVQATQHLGHGMTIMMGEAAHLLMLECERTR